jgi:hypothetical protein
VCGRRRHLLAVRPNIFATARGTTSNFWGAGLRKTGSSARGRLIFRLASLARREGGTVSVWALDFSRRNFYDHLEGDHELPIQPAMVQREL